MSIIQSRHSVRWWFAGLALMIIGVLPFQISSRSKGAEPQAPSQTTPPYAFIISDWRFFDENKNGGAGAFVTGPDTPPVGQGSAMLQVNNNSQGYALVTQVLHPKPLRLDRIKILRYSTYRASSDPNNNLAISFQIPVDFDLTDGNTSYQGRLVFEPYFSGASVPQNMWQTWDMLSVRGWWDTKGQLSCKPCTWQEILNAYPNIGLHPVYSGILFKAGSGWDSFQGYIDRFEIAIDDESNLFSFDFDPPPMVKEVHLGGEIVSSGQVLTRTGNTLRIVFQHDAPFYQPQALWNYPNHPDDITNPANYQLSHINLGAIPINQVTYFEDTSTHTYYVTLRVNNGQPLPNGWYSLTISGTTSVVDISGIPLAGNGTTAGTDFNLEFAIRVPPKKLPETGYPPIRGKKYPTNIQKGLAYQTQIHMEIPRLQMKAPIVGIPQSGDTWDVKWLYDQVGWLEGSAFPTWVGNTVLTAHVWNYDGTPGLFYRLRELRYGDQIFIKAWGKTYVYEVRERLWVSPRDVATVFESKKRDWITLITCWGYNPLTNSYLLRFGIRAVLMEVRSMP